MLQKSSKREREFEIKPATLVTDTLIHHPRNHIYKQHWIKSNPLLGSKVKSTQNKLNLSKRERETVRKRENADYKTNLYTHTRYEIYSKEKQTKNKNKLATSTPNNKKSAT